MPGSRGTPEYSLWEKLLPEYLGIWMGVPCGTTTSQPSSLIFTSNLGSAGTINRKTGEAVASSPARVTNEGQASEAAAAIPLVNDHWPERWS